MVNHPWVDKAVHDNALVCEVLLQLHQEVSQPQIPQPPPPPPMPQPLPPPTMSQAPEQDAPMIYIDWGVRQPRSRRTEVRPVTARSEVIVGGSTNLVSKRGATSTGNLEKSGRRSLNRSNASRSKAILSEPSGRRTPTRRPRKHKERETRKIVIEHKNEKEPP